MNEYRAIQLTGIIILLSFSGIKIFTVLFPDPLYRLCYASSMAEVLDIVDSLGDHVTPMQSSQALSTLFHIQKFAAYVVDYVDETDHLECRAEFNRTLREQERYVRLVEMVSQHFLYRQCSSVLVDFFAETAQAMMHSRDVILSSLLKLGTWVEAR